MYKELQALGSESQVMQKQYRRGRKLPRVTLFYVVGLWLQADLCGKTKSGIQSSKILLSMYRVFAGIGLPFLIVAHKVLCFRSVILK